MIEERKLSKTSKLELIACGIILSAVFSVGAYNACKFICDLDLNKTLNWVYYRGMNYDNNK